MNSDITAKSPNVLQISFAGTDVKANQFLDTVFELPGVEKTTKCIGAGKVAVRFAGPAEERIKDIKPLLPLINPQAITIDGEVIQI